MMEEEPKEKKGPKSWKVLIYIIIGLIIILGVAFLVRYLDKPDAYTFDEIYQKTLEGDESENNYLYNGFVFVKIGPLWYTRIQKGNQPYNIPFLNDPRSVEDVELRLPMGVVEYSEIYLTMDPEASAKIALAAIEVGRITGDKYNLLNIPTKTAFTKEPTSSKNVTRPIRECRDAVNGTGIIFFEKGPENAVYTVRQCVVIEGKTEDDVIRAADKFAFKLLGIV